MSDDNRDANIRRRRSDREADARLQEQIEDPSLVDAARRVLEVSDCTYQRASKMQASCAGVLLKNGRR